MKVLLISHTCMSRTAGQPKAHCLAAFPDLDLTVLVPDRMWTYGQWQTAETPEWTGPPSFRYVIGQTRWRNVLNQWYLQHYADALPRLLREFQPDIVDIWEEPWGLACAQAVHLTRRLCPQAKIIVETEQNIFKRLPPPFQQFQDYTLRRADFVVARSQEAVGVVRRKGYPGPAAVVPNAVDTALFRPLPPAERSAQRARLGWGGSDDFVAGYVGRLVPEKGLADLVEALARLPDTVRLALVGAGPFQAELEAQAQRLKVADRIHFAGSRPLTDLPGCINAMDVLVLPSRTTPQWKEQFGRVLIEAAACGIATIGSDSGAIPDVISEGGVVFPEGNAVELANHLHLLMTEPDRRRQYGRAGCERARRLFNWQQVARQMRGIYQEQTGEKAVTAPKALTEEAFGGKPTAE